MSLKFRLSVLRAQSWILLAVGQRDRAQSCFDEMLKLQSDFPFALASRAHLLAQAGLKAQAAVDLSRLTTLEPTRDVHWFNLGYVLDGLGRQEEAVQAFERATKLNPKLDQAWYGMGLALLQLQRVDQAIEALKRNTELQPMSPYGWTQLARAHVRAEQLPKAQKVVEHLRGFEPKVAEALTRELKLDAAR